MPLTQLFNPNVRIGGNWDLNGNNLEKRVVVGRIIIGVWSFPKSVVSIHRGSGIITIDGTTLLAGFH